MTCLNRCICKKIFWVVFPSLLMLFVNGAFAQSELKPWGDLAGIRLKGQLFDFSSTISVVSKDGKRTISTGKEKQRPKYNRDGNTQTVTTQIDSLYFIETATDGGLGKMKLTLSFTAHEDIDVKGIFLNITLPYHLYKNGLLAFNKSKSINLIALGKIFGQSFQNNNAAGITLRSGTRKISVRCTDSSEININIKPINDRSAIRISFPIKTGEINKGEHYEKTFLVDVADVIERKPAIVSVNRSKVGRRFDGFGGNFRIQNPMQDSIVIDYCIKNLKIAWARVEMPWRYWQPDLNIDPTENADKGNLNRHVKASMAIAQRLSKLHIPIILTAWSPPEWAIEGKPHYGPAENGIWGNPLNQNKLAESYKSIADYIFYLKNHYGFEVKYFSFNESDLGINIRQTGEEHASLIKGLGAYFISRGLTTKLLLGDNSDATTYKFIDPALADPTTHPYIGAVSFHSWRGWDKPTLQKWNNAANKLKKPLIVAEGSIDAAAYAYPVYLQEPAYALEEINLYTRLLDICEPLSILQWQLTSDYSPLTGGGIYGDKSPLKPTQRFWNLKQLAASTANVYHINATINNPNISCAVLGNKATGKYVIHLVNNGAAREVIIKGLPSNILQYFAYITDKNQDMVQANNIKVIHGKLSVYLKARSFTTLVNKQMKQ